MPNVNNVAPFISVTSFAFVGNEIESFLRRPGSWLLLHVAAVIKCIHTASNVWRKALNRGDGVRQEENVRITFIDVSSFFPELCCFFFAPRRRKTKPQKQHGINSSRLFLTSSVKVTKMSAGPEKTERCIRSGRARPHLFALWANTCQQLSVCSSRRAFLSANQCSFGRCVSKCHPKSNNCFLPFSFKAVCLWCPSLRQAIKSTAVSREVKNEFWCSFTGSSGGYDKLVKFILFPVFK